jgi:hypothetical protein
VFGSELLARFECRKIQLDGLQFLPELPPERMLHLGQVDFKQVRQHAVVNHVLDEPAQLRVLADLGHDLVERYRVEHQVLAQVPQLQRLVVDHRRIGSEREHVLTGRLAVHRHQEIDLLLAGDVPVLVGPDRVPRRQSGDVRGKKVLARDRNPHLEDGAQQHEIRRLAARPVDGRNLYAEIVDDAPAGTGVSRGHSESS